MPTFTRSSAAPKDKITVITPVGTIEVADKPVLVDDPLLAAELALVPFLSIVQESKTPTKEEK